MTLMEFSDFDLTLPNNKKIITESNINIQAGDFILLKGENGSGKTTILNTINNLGCNGIKIEGKDVAREAEARKDFISVHRRKSIYLCQEEPFLNQFSIFEALKEPALSAGADPVKCNELSEKYFNKYLNNWFSQDCAPKKLRKRKADKLSGGQKKFLRILSQIIKMELCGAYLVLLDEPLNDLDLVRKEWLSELIKDIPRINKNPDYAVIMISHCPIFPEVNRVMTITDGVLTITEKGNGEYCDCTVAQKCSKRGAN